MKAGSLRKLVFLAGLLFCFVTMVINIKNKDYLEDFDDKNNVKILFIGNSFTNANDLPQTFKTIARSKNKKVTVETAVLGGAKLSDHLERGLTQVAINQKKWDYIILQEQSQLPALDNIGAEQEFFTPLRKLVTYIRRENPTAQIVLYETWGYQNGDQWSCRWIPANCTYTGMQEALIENYHEIAAEISATVAPIGEVWQLLRTTRPEIELYSPDGIHPSQTGSYLAAATIFRTIFRESVAGTPYLGVNEPEGAAIQQAADQMPIENVK